ncbi:MAG: GNAT family N-acetyltransferase [Candidatus Falkowbacteria bacterium]|nr:GNAT family N-acetyltransferase [Candidatus Falkowbacteria bacterium]
MFDRIIKVVETPEELKTYQELIFQVYCQELKWFNPDKYPQGRVADEFDSQSIHFLMIDKASEEVMAVMRLIRSSPLSLPIFSKFGEKKPTADFFQSHHCQPVKNCEVEISQVAALKKFRERRLSFVVDTGKIFYQYCQRNSLSYMYFTVDLRVFLELHKHYLWVEPIGVPKFYFGSWVLPCVAFLGEWVEKLEKNNPRAFDYVINPNNLVGSFKDDNLQNG